MWQCVAGMGSSFGQEAALPGWRLPFRLGEETVGYVPPELAPVLEAEVVMMAAGEVAEDLGAVTPAGAAASEDSEAAILEVAVQAVTGKD